MADNQVHRLEVDPTTSPWSIKQVPSMASEPVIDNSAALTARRAEYLPKLRAVVMHIAGDLNALIYKF